MSKKMLLEWILSNYQKNPSVKEMAFLCQMSVTTFYRVFREWFGVAPGEFVQELRMGEARVLLKTTTLQIQQISKTVGFSDLSVFCSQFVKRHGMTPSMYRRRYWENVE